MQTRHTPGPWFTEALSTIGHCAIVDADGFTVANPSPMGQANARLIAAAPEMLALLREVVDARNANTRALKEAIQKASPGWIRDARAAIARATAQ